MSEELIALLDPDRSYGEPDYDEVVEGVQCRKLRLEDGRRLPVIKDASTNLLVRGTGQPALPLGTEPRKWGRREFIRRAAEDFDETPALSFAGQPNISSLRYGRGRRRRSILEELLPKSWLRRALGASIEGGHPGGRTRRARSPLSSSAIVCQCSRSARESRLERTCLRQHSSGSRC